MNSPKEIRRPDNWQDFETLCKKLWGEAWKIPDEIKKNGRSGDAQNGVDVYGIPEGEEKYYGIQCKGKDSYISKRLSKKEIEEEIVKAQSFRPALKKFYIATTAVKNAEIEEYVRVKNLENKSKGLFEVHLFSWEDIAELIEDHPQTFAWYVKHQNYHSICDVQVLLNGNVLKSDGKFVWQPEFIEKRIETITKEAKELLDQSAEHKGGLDFGDKFAMNDKIRHLSNPWPRKKTWIDKSLIPFAIRIHNSGETPVDNLSFFMEFHGATLEVRETNLVSEGTELIPAIYSYVSTSVYGKKIEFHPRSKTLVSGLDYSLDELFIKFPPEKQQFELEWNIYSREFKSSGKIFIEVDPVFKPDWEIEVGPSNSERIEIVGRLEEQDN